MNFEKLRSYIDTLPDIGIPFADCAVALDHEIVFRHSSGFTDAERTKPVSGDDLFWLFSATKPITCTAAMQLVAAGKHEDLYESCADYRKMVDLQKLEEEGGGNND